MFHSAEDCISVCTNQTIKYGMKGSVASRTDNVKQYNKSKKMKEGSESSQEEGQYYIQHCQ